MNVYILDRSYRTLAVVDVFESFLWIERYNGVGECELYSYVSDDLLAKTQKGYYLSIDQSDRLMIIDHRKISTDVEEGNKLEVKGRSLEAILDRRIVWAQTILTGNFQTGIRRLINENIISATATARRIPNFIFASSTDPAITTLTRSVQYTGTNLYTAIHESCQEQSLGFKIILNDSGQFVFSLYKGTDRSLSQTTNSYVVFSPEFGNLLNSEYTESDRLLKTAALVAGEGEGAARRTVAIGGGTGLDRRELFVDARDISSEVDGGTLTPSEYNALLIQRGADKMTEYVEEEIFEGDVETTQVFVYGRDFFLGDIVEIQNEYGLGSSARIVEMIFSSNREGESVVPTFETIR